jgi:hypothetical protein
MSPKRDKNVQTLVEKYRRNFPGLESRFLRRLIRSENKGLFSNPSQLKQLTRCLKKSYAQPVQGKTESSSVDVSAEGRAQSDFDNQLKMYRLARKISDTGTPLTVRDVDWRLGKYHVKIEHE